MKIAFLNIYDEVNNRGAESFSRELARRLSKNHQVDFYAGKDYGVKIVQPEHNLKKFSKRFFLDKANLSVLNFTLKIFPKLKNYDWIIPMNSFWQVLLCKFLSGKILITGHSGPGWDERWNLYLKPDVFVATTEPTADWAKKTCFYTKVVTIPYGIEEYKNVVPAKINLEKPIILCPAAAVDYKRIDLAIKAVARLKKGSLLHLGDGLLLSQIKLRGQELLGKRFKSLIVQHEEISKYYAACDLVTLPSSEQENSPMVFLESMAAGKVCVTTDTSRTRWILGETGVYVNPADTNAYAITLQNAVTKKTVFSNQLKKYSWDLILEKYERALA